MAGPATVLAKRAELARAVAEWPEVAGEAASWAVVFINAVPTGGDLRALREAGKICDRVAAVRLSADKLVAPGLAELVGGAGADLLWVPREIEGEVRVEGVAVDAASATVMMQALISVLPNVVVMSRAEAMWTRALAGLARGLGEVAPVRVVD